MHIGTLKFCLRIWRRMEGKVLENKKNKKRKEEIEDIRRGGLCEVNFCFIIKKISSFGELKS